MIVGCLAVFAFCALLLSCAHHAAPAVAPTSEPSAPEATAEEVKQRPTEDRMVEEWWVTMPFRCRFAPGESRINAECDETIGELSAFLLMSTHIKGVKLQGSADIVYDGFAGEPPERNIPYTNVCGINLTRPHPLSTLLAYEKAVEFAAALHQKSPYYPYVIQIENSAQHIYESFPTVNVNCFISREKLLDHPL
jgi:hypothetical protein